MLILNRKNGESVTIGDEIQVTVLSVDSGRVRLAIDAPRSVSIVRSELIAAAETNQDAACEAAEPAALLQMLGGVLDPNQKQGG